MQRCRQNLFRLQDDVAAPRGITLVEVLVACGVCMLLVGVTFPALLQQRSVSRVEKCRARLQQIGVALSSYHDVHNLYPPGWVTPTHAPQGPAQFSWLARLLPHVDEADLYHSLKIESPVRPTTENPSLVKPLAFVRCPADLTAAKNPFRDGYATSNYSGNFGDEPIPRATTGRETKAWPGQQPTPKTANGIFWANSSVGMRDVTDGLASTLLGGERALTSYAGLWPVIGGNQFENDLVTDGNHRSRINVSTRAYSSRHPEGVHFLMGDGAVRFVNQNIDSQPHSGGAAGVFQRLSNRWDGLAIPDFE